MATEPIKISELEDIPDNQITGTGYLPFVSDAGTDSVLTDDVTFRIVLSQVLHWIQAHFTRDCAVFASTTEQTTQPDSSIAITFDTTLLSNQYMTIDSKCHSYITIANAGRYKIEYDAQVEITNNQELENEKAFFVITYFGSKIAESARIVNVKDSDDLQSVHCSAIIDAVANFGVGVQMISDGGNIKTVYEAGNNSFPTVYSGKLTITKLGATNE